MSIGSRDGRSKSGLVLRFGAGMVAGALYVVVRQLMCMRSFQKARYPEGVALIYSSPPRTAVVSARNTTIRARTQDGLGAHYLAC